MAAYSYQYKKNKKNVVIYEASIIYYRDDDSLCKLRM